MDTCAYGWWRLPKESTQRPNGEVVLTRVRTHSGVSTLLSWPPSLHLPQKFIDEDKALKDVQMLLGMAPRALFHGIVQLETADRSASQSMESGQIPTTEFVFTPFGHQL